MPSGAPPSDDEHQARWRRACFLAVDVETTGLAPQRDRVIEVAWVRFEGGAVTHQSSSLCRIDTPLPRVIRALTRITDEELAGAPSFAEVAPDLLEALAQVDFAVAYNASFDMGFLRAELARVGAALPAVQFLDPLG